MLVGNFVVYLLHLFVGRFCSSLGAIIIALNSLIILLWFFDFQEEEYQGQASNVTDQLLELSIMDDHNLKQNMFAETVKQWKEENDAMEAKCKVKNYFSFSFFTARLTRF